MLGVGPQIRRTSHPPGVSLQSPNPNTGEMDKDQIQPGVPEGEIGQIHHLSLDTWGMEKKNGSGWDADSNRSGSGWNDTTRSGSSGWGNSTNTKANPGTNWGETLKPGPQQNWASKPQDNNVSNWGGAASVKQTGTGWIGGPVPVNRRTAVRQLAGKNPLHRPFAAKWKLMMVPQLGGTQATITIKL